MATFPSRAIGDLAFPEVSQRLRDTSILLLPVGAIEQHGPHLPLNTDTVIAEELTRRMILRWGDTYDLWQLPTLSISVSRETGYARSPAGNGKRGHLPASSSYDSQALAKTPNVSTTSAARERATISWLKPARA